MKKYEAQIKNDNGTAKAVTWTSSKEAAIKSFMESEKCPRSAIKFQHIAKPKILRIVIQHEVDEYPDTSWLGEYTDKPERWNIIRSTGEYVDKVWRRDALLYKIVDEIERCEDEIKDISTKRTVKRLARLNYWLKKVQDSGNNELPEHSREYRYFKPYGGGEPEGSKLYQQYGLQDFNRMESLSNGHWNFIGIIAKAEIQLADSDIIQTIRSGGLWGIESDSGNEYIEQVEREQLEELAFELEKIGHGKRAIEYAIKNKEVKQ